MKTFKLDCDIGYETGDTWWGRQVGPDAVSDFLAGCNPGERVTIEINSAGGLCIPGFAIANSIKNSQAHVVAHVVGLAASMASVVMCACDEIQLEEGSFVMIHNPWSWAEGDAEELRKEAEVLDTMKAGIMAFYRAKFPGKSDEEISGLMDAETWMTGTDALRAGLKCVVIPTTMRAAASATRHHFAHVPEAAARFLEVKDRPPEVQPAEEQPVEEIISAASEVSEPSTISASDSGEPHSPEQGDSLPQTQALAPSTEKEKGVEIASVQQQESAWEARLAGLQAAKDKELAEMSAKYKAGIADMKARHEAAVADLQNQLQAKAQELESAKAETSSLALKLGNAEQALAQTREQLEAEIAQHRKLASAALQQPKDGPDGALSGWAAAMHEITLARRGKKK